MVTNAPLSVCAYDPETIDIQSGILGDAAFEQVDFIRFRKSLVNRWPNDYQRSREALNDWAASRERTVFVVSPLGLSRFLSGFRAFHYRDGSSVPPQFAQPPNWGEDDDGDG